ncbi:hypothetical protein EDB85DRAFT_61878 [Lactarius pseudohatsudake]|nr:hypothetical protein EDB85DRAFT_61878 [Lactarius pseudohatsudake]
MRMRTRMKRMEGCSERQPVAMGGPFSGLQLGRLYNNTSHILCFLLLYLQCTTLVHCSALYDTVPLNGKKKLFIIIHMCQLRFDLFSHTTEGPCSLDPRYRYKILFGFPFPWDVDHQFTFSLFFFVCSTPTSRSPNSFCSCLHPPLPTYCFPSLHLLLLPLLGSRGNVIFPISYLQQGAPQTGHASPFG